MIFKRKAKESHKDKIAQAIISIRKAREAGLDYDKFFRAELEEKFDCKVPGTLSPAEFIAHLAGIDASLLSQAVADMVAGGDPAKYRWLGMRNNLPEFHAMVAALFVMEEAA